VIFAVDRFNVVPIRNDAVVARARLPSAERQKPSYANWTEAQPVTLGDGLYAAIVSFVFCRATPDGKAHVYSEYRLLTNLFVVNGFR
jgi:hypothetical protein